MVPGFSVVGYGMLFLDRMRFWYFFVGLDLFMVEGIVIAMQDKIKISDSDSQLCSEAVTNRVSDQAAIIFAIAALEITRLIFWHILSTLHSTRQLEYINIDKYRLTRSGFGWTVCYYLLSCAGVSWGLVYLHIFRISEIAIGAALGLIVTGFNCVILYFYIIPNFAHSRTKFVLHYLCLNKTELF